jgi:SulP family sulfate permease
MAEEDTTAGGERAPVAGGADGGSRSGIGRDIVAGVTTAIANIPDSMANAVLAGINPVNGLHALLVGTPSAALTTSSQFMTVAVTAAMALAVGDGLAAVPAGQQAAGLLTLTVMVGVVMIVLGLLRAGALMRFVSNAVMRGFLTGVAVSIVLGQVPSFTGSTSDASNKVMRTVDIVLHPSRIDVATLVLGLATIAVVLLLERTPVARFSMAAALLLATGVAYVGGFAGTTVGDISAIPSTLPTPELPALELVFVLIVPAVSIALIGLIQGAGVSKATPNPDGTYPSLDRDFIGQGIGNALSGLFKGMPVGGSVSSTSLNIQAGARSRWANFTVGPVIAIVLLLFSGVIEVVPMTALAALLIIVGVRAVDRHAIAAVWNTGAAPRAIMTITFVGTLIMPIQYAVLLGVAISIVSYVYSASLDVRLVEMVQIPDGRFAEVEPPEQPKSNSVTVLNVYGSLFYAGAQVVEKMLPDPLGTQEAYVVLRLRGRVDVGSTFLEVLKRYEGRLEREGGHLLLAGVGDDLYAQLERTGMLEVIGEEDVFHAVSTLGDSTSRAVRAAEERLGKRVMS